MIDAVSGEEERTRHPGIVRRGSRYQIRYRDRSGRSHRRNARTLAEALDLQAQLRRERHRPHVDRSVTFKAYAEDWIVTYTGRTTRGIRESTRADYKRTIEREAIPFFGTMRLADIAPPDVRRYLAHIARRGVSDHTVRLALAPLRALLATAYEDGAIPTNPAAGIRAIVTRPDREPTEHDGARALTDEQLERLIASTPERWQLLVRVLSETGLRISEALALRWGDVDLGQHKIAVRRRLYRGRMGPPKSAYGRRDVPVSPDLAQTLWAARGASRTPLDSDPVFASAVGGHMNAANLARRALKPAAETAGVGWASWHTLRHTCATRLFRAGLNAKQVQVWMGHHSPAFTLAVYVHLLSDDLPPSPFSAAGGHTRDTRAPETPGEAASAESAETATLRAIQG
jgi:integrase